MSFDVYLQTTVVGSHGEPHGETLYEFNLTHNVNEIVETCLVEAAKAMGIAPPVGTDEDSGYNERSWGRLHGHKVQDVVELVATASLISINPEYEATLRASEPANRWGTLDTVRRVFAELVINMRYHLDATIRCSG